LGLEEMEGEFGETTDRSWPPPARAAADIELEVVMVGDDEDDGGGN